MICECCDLRSSVGFCAECGKLVCEECGAKCEACGRLMCPAHIAGPASFRRVCPQCLEESDSFKHAGPETAPAGHGHAHARLTPPEPEPVLELPPAWKLSLYTAGVAALFVFFLFIFPPLRHLPLTPRVAFPVPVLVGVLPLAGLIWALVGIRRREKEQDYCYFGLILSAALLVFTVVAYWIDPGA